MAKSRKNKTLFKKLLFIYTIIAFILVIIFLIYIFLTLQTYEINNLDKEQNIKVIDEYNNEVKLKKEKYSYKLDKNYLSFDTYNLDFYIFLLLLVHLFFYY